MQRTLLCLVLFLVLADPGPGRSNSAAEKPPERGLTDGVLVREAREIKRLYDVATLKNDGGWFERVFAPDYVWIGPSGETVNKAEYVRDVQSRDITWSSMRVEDMQVRAYGETAIATGRFYGKGQYKGKPLNEHQRFTSVLIKRNGRWQIVSEHCSTLTPADQ